MLKNLINGWGVKNPRLMGDQIKRLISLSASNGLKRIDVVEDKAKKTITIEGKYLNAEQEFGTKVLKFEQQTNEKSTGDTVTQQIVRPCSFCEMEKKGIYVQYTDVLVLRQFLTEDGAILPKSVTGLCKRQHRKLTVLTKQAKHAGLLLNLEPTLLDGTKPPTEPYKRPKHLKWNSYFDKYEIMIRTHKYL